VSINAFDVAAEQALLGAAMEHPDIVGSVLRAVPFDAWYVPKHADLAAVLLDLMAAGAVDATIVLGEVMERGLVGKLPADYLLTLIQRPWIAEHAPDYAARVRELGARRKLTEHARRLAQRLDAGWESGDETDATTAIKQFRGALDEVEQQAASQVYVPLSMAELLQGEDTHDWLIPGLLERGERIILTGGEGHGKSVLCSQIAACLAGGLHPFTGRPLGSGGHQIRVLVVDCENNALQTRRRYRRLISTVDDIRSHHVLSRVDWRTSMFVELRPGGVDLLSGRDVSWLERCVAAVSPHLLLLGPLYQLHHSNMNDETAARELVYAIDGIRVRHNVALLTEAHAGHAEDGRGDRRMRPSGSSLWLRWPEFGYGLRRAKEAKNPDRPEIVDVVAWRGSREERAWPRQLVHGKNLPWRPYEPHQAEVVDIDREAS